MTLWDQTRYALDANVLMAAHRDYYARDICPGFWEFLAHHIDARRFLIIDKVRGEILYPPNWFHGSTRRAAATLIQRRRKRLLTPILRCRHG